VAAARGGKPTYGDFLLAHPISEAFNLAAVSLRLGGKRLLFDAAGGRITNVEGVSEGMGAFERLATRLCWQMEKERARIG
jgi:hypothetical protein